MNNQQFPGFPAGSGDRPPADRLLLRPAEVMRVLGVSEPVLRGWVEMGRLRVVRTPGNHRRFLTADVSALLAGAKKE